MGVMKKGILMSISLYLIIISIVFTKQPVFAISNLMTNKSIGQALDKKENREPTIIYTNDVNIVKNEIDELKKQKRVVLYNEMKKEREKQQDKQLDNQKTRKITISAVGDVTIGSDENFGYRNTFIEEVDKYNNDYFHFVEAVYPIFEQDDITIANLETTLTTAEKKANKKFRFKGEPDYVKILKEGSIEAVNIANNHIHDYLDKGFKDTVNTLENEGIGYFGYHDNYTTTKQGIHVGFLGYEGWEASDKLMKQIKKDIESLKEQTDLIVISFHWGIERENYPYKDQLELAHYAVDQGADLVLGHHPHVLQGIEKYKEKFIVYSLGNFLFGGNKNPSDKDSLIFQQSFHFDSEGNLLPVEEIQLIPCSISSVSWRNDYKPVPLEGEDKERVLGRLVTYSSIFKESFSPTNETKRIVTKKE